MAMIDTNRVSTVREKQDTESVLVGVRVRPLLPKDIAEGARECLRKVPDEPQVVLGVDRAFTFDHVFESTASQDYVYSQCMDHLVQGVMVGLNATVLAYGQTGSGKTHTMGSSVTSAEAALQGPNEKTNAFDPTVGLIPRALHELFRAISECSGAKCNAKASFIEIYKEEVLDLLSCSTESDQLASLPIREENGQVSLTGLQQRKVRSVVEAMGVLAEGARSRSTGATAMNASSSRSHAIFTISLELSCSGKTVSPRLNFVDLAGSERAKRTGASGERLLEGIQINKGLLALGNVINALCEKHSHVPYRDSKLTRLLQDSLGGNSRTLMLACVSPADADLEETLNTLKYANRARQIRNKPLVVQDPLQAQISQLQEQVVQLQARLSHYEAGGGPLPALTDSAPTAASNKSDALLVKRVAQLEEENRRLRARMAALVTAGSAEPNELRATSSTVHSLSASLSSSSSMQDEEGARRRGGEGDICASTHSPSAEEESLLNEQLEEEMEFQREQGGISEQLQGLDETLALKQALLKSQGADKEEVAALHTQLNQLEAELLDLSKERESLISQVEVLRKRSATKEEESRMARKLEAVEAELQRLRGQQSKQAAELRARQASERRVKELENEIESIKANKVALMRRQREEAELHRLQRRDRENELRALRRREERTSAQLHKLEEENAKQAVVLKRKSEEIIAQQKRLRMHENVGLNKSRTSGFGSTTKPSCPGRLSTTTASQAAKIEGKRADELGRAVDKMFAKPREWLAEEIEAVLTVKDLQAQMQTQIAQRRATQLKLNALEELEQQASKEMVDLKSVAKAGEEVAACSEASAARQAELEALRMKVEHHNTELQALQGRLLKCETDEKKTLTKIDALSSVQHSKAVLKQAIPQLVQLRVAAKRAEQILAVKVSAMKTQQELIDALHAELEKQRKQGAAEQLQLMERLQQVQQALEAERAGPRAQTGAPRRSSLKEEDNHTAAKLEMRLQALKRATAAPNPQRDARRQSEEEMEDGESEEDEESEEESEEEDGDSSDGDWLASEDARAQLPRRILANPNGSSRASTADAPTKSEPLPVRRGRRSVTVEREATQPSEENKQAATHTRRSREPPSKAVDGGEVPVAQVNLAKGKADGEKRVALGSLDSNSLEKLRGRSNKDEELNQKEAHKRRLYSGGSSAVMRELF